MPGFPVQDQHTLTLWPTGPMCRVRSPSSGPGLAPVKCLLLQKGHIGCCCCCCCPCPDNLLAVSSPNSLRPCCDAKSHASNSSVEWKFWAVESGPLLQRLPRITALSDAQMPTNTKGKVPNSKGIVDWNCHADCLIVSHAAEQPCRVSK